MSDSSDALEYSVDIAAADAAVERIKAHVRSTFRPEVLSELGGFGGLFAFDNHGYASPVLVGTTDGVGTKSHIARLMHRYDTIGIDLVAMSVDDLAVQGAQPLFFLDYISTGKLDPAMMDALVDGVANGCRQAGCALIGGEMSEHPGLMEPGEFDLVGFAVGVVDRDAILPRDVRAGDAIIGFASPGLRSNGYSLARAALLERARFALDAPAWPGAQRSLGEELLTPSVIYAPAMLELRGRVGVHAFAHITGGGLPGNVVRVLPSDCDAVITRGTWDVPRIFSVIQAAGTIAPAEMERVFNCGVGMVAIVPGHEVGAALEVLEGSGHAAWRIGDVQSGSGQVHLVDS
ncbi:MAG: phosphoribosylformylglycinamidine cyclo-ligase [Acidimicrobiia bacterium]